MRLALFRPSSGQGKHPPGMPERCRICACLVRHRLNTPACRSQRICRGCRPKQTAHYAQKSALTITADAVVQANGQGAAGPDRACRFRKGNAASHDGHGTRAAVDLPPRRQVRARMETKDGSFGHDPAGSCTAIALHPLIPCALGNRACPGGTDGEAGVSLRVTLEPEADSREGRQRYGWQAILDRLARHAEGNRQTACRFGPSCPVPEECGVEGFDNRKRPFKYSCSLPGQGDAFGPLIAGRNLTVDQTLSFEARSDL